MSKTVKYQLAFSLWRFLAFCCFCVCATGSRDEYFLSVTGLENLLNVESVMMDELQLYLDSMQNHINMLQSEVNSIRLEHSIASENIDGYLSNPINAYRLIKRLQSDWSMIEESIRLDPSKTDFLVEMEKNRQSYDFPTKEDVIGSAMGLARLQDTYKLDVGELASGILNGNKYGSSMSWQDCFFIGQHLYEVSDFNHTIQWLKQSAELLKKQEETNDPYVLDFMEAIVAYHHGIGDLENALELVNYILTIDAGREETANLKLSLETMIRDGFKTGLMHDLAPQAGDYHLSEDFKRYEQVCRGELLLTPEEQRLLKCRLVTNNVPYRLLQPFKIEELSLDPHIVQIHDVISVDDTKSVKDLAKTRVSRSVVRSLDDMDGSAVNYRISKSAWFDYDESEHIQKIERNMRDLSQLNMESAEQLQVTNYGIGGHYEPHYDFFGENEIGADGNRIATGIFYLSEVEEGGGTAFPHLRLLVKPEQGSVLLWHNLHRSGEPDYRTRHAACPVLKGSKWIGNIWIRERHQDRERPCGLEPDHEISLKYKDLL